MYTLRLLLLGRYSLLSTCSKRLRRRRRRRPILRLRYITTFYSARLCSRSTRDVEPIKFFSSKPRQQPASGTCMHKHLVFSDSPTNGATWTCSLFLALSRPLDYYIQLCPHMSPFSLPCVFMFNTKRPNEARYCLTVSICTIRWLIIGNFCETDAHRHSYVRCTPNLHRPNCPGHSSSAIGNLSSRFLTLSRRISSRLGRHSQLNVRLVSRIIPIKCEESLIKSCLIGLRNSLRDEGSRSWNIIGGGSAILNSLYRPCAPLTSALCECMCMFFFTAVDI